MFCNSLCGPWTKKFGDPWIRKLRTTWLMVCSSVPHSQAPEEAIPRLHKQKWKCPTLVRKRLSWTHAVLGRAITRRVNANANDGDESIESYSVLQPLSIPSVIHPECRTWVVVRWIVQGVQVDVLIWDAVHSHLVDRWTWVEQVSRLHGMVC